METEKTILHQQRQLYERVRKNIAEEKENLNKELLKCIIKDLCWLSFLFAVGSITILLVTSMR